MHVRRPTRGPGAGGLHVRGCCACRTADGIRGHGSSAESVGPASLFLGTGPAEGVGEVDAGCAGGAFGAESGAEDQGPGIREHGGTMSAELERANGVSHGHYTFEGRVSGPQRAQLPVCQFRSMQE